MTLVKILTALLIPIFASEAFGDSGAGASASAESRPSTTGANHSTTHSTTPGTPTNKNIAAIEAIASVVHACALEDVDCNGTPATYSPHSPQEETTNMLLVNKGMPDYQPLPKSSDPAAVDGYGVVERFKAAAKNSMSNNHLAPTDSDGCEQDHFEIGKTVTYKMPLNRGDCSPKPSSNAILGDPRVVDTGASSSAPAPAPSTTRRGGIND